MPAFRFPVNGKITTGGSSRTTPTPGRTRRGSPGARGAHTAPANQSSAVLLRAGRAIGVAVTPAGTRGRRPDDRGPVHVKTIPENQRYMAKRMGATSRAHPVDHMPIITDPTAVVDLIREAIRSVTGS